MPDHTFRFYDNSAGTVEASGKWKQEKLSIVLYDYQANPRIPSKWKLEGGNECIKSRRGAEFLRICSTGTCASPAE
jgi:hypothetical protein